ncbi:hypothetical protein CEXT_24641 [Caerostris extrusa]|uniref:Uncharacterized protein n=1 Tax=Caerostris extrusa TaxID=172846 RepID=A0AAV4V9P7_CAEEX|nr:hypothetical protein CEXT_24641 [Caerostris extrusa]
MISAICTIPIRSDCRTLQLIFRCESLIFSGANRQLNALDGQNICLRWFSYLLQSKYLHYMIADRQLSLLDGQDINVRWVRYLFRSRCRAEEVISRQKDYETMPGIDN